jgi:hypothetical protein
MMQFPLLFLVMYDWIYLYDTMLLLLLCMHWLCLMIQHGCYVNLVQYLWNMVVGYDANMPSAS